MARRRSAHKREFIPDPKFQSVLVSQFISTVVKQGKKRTAEGIVYDAIEEAGRKTQSEGLAVFKKAIENVKPTLEVKSRRVGGANYQIPIEVSPERRTSLAIRWLVLYSRERTEKSMAEKLCAELVQASKNEGGAIRKKIDTHKMAEANRAFAHFRW